ncbi:hypothetical protein B0H13DRAFT_1882378 [Mycena leptocephala]|nr:hypothetical protein B0H13DRAFT_1882378 [Mycena leptocephala]
MARPSKRTQKLRKNAQKATQSRKARVEDSDSDSDGDSGPAAVPITSHPTSLSHDEHSRCQHDHHCPPPDFDAGETWDFDLGNDLPDLDCDEWLSGEDELDDEVVEAPEISEETELKTFATLLNDAQEAARVREREREKASRRPKHYNKTSKSTKYRNRNIYTWHHCWQAQETKHQSWSYTSRGSGVERRSRRRRMKSLCRRAGVSKRMTRDDEAEKRNRVLEYVVYSMPVIPTNREIEKESNTPDVLIIRFRHESFIHTRLTMAKVLCPQFGYAIRATAGAKLRHVLYMRIIRASLGPSRILLLEEISPDSFPPHVNFEKIKIHKPYFFEIFSPNFSGEPHNSAVSHCNPQSVDYHSKYLSVWPFPMYRYDSINYGCELVRVEEPQIAFSQLYRVISGKDASCLSKNEVLDCGLSNSETSGGACHEPG